MRENEIVLAGSFLDKLVVTDPRHEDTGLEYNANLRT